MSKIRWPKETIEKLCQKSLVDFFEKKGKKIFGPDVEEIILHGVTNGKIRFENR